MNIYEKLQKCRVELQSANIKKSGQNKFAGYTYYELGDFLPTINKLFAENKLFSAVTFDSEVARLAIINTEKPDEMVVFTSPMAGADLKGCHSIQNLGAVQTYQRRYLYMSALEIVEHDALDSTTGKTSEKPKAAKKSGADTGSKLTPEQRSKILELQKQNGVTADTFNKRLKAKYNITNIDQLTENQAASIIESMESKNGAG